MTKSPTYETKLSTESLMAVWENATPAEKGEMLLAIEKRFLELFEGIPFGKRLFKGKRLLSMTNPHVKAFVDAAEKAKGFGGAK